MPTFQAVILAMSGYQAAVFLMGSLFLLALLSAWARYAGAGGWCTVTRQGMVFRHPRVRKVLLVAFGLYLLFGMLFVFAGFLKTGQPIPWWPDADLLMAFFVCFIFLMFWAAGKRRELCLDLDRRTYRLVFGWGPWTRESSGTWEEFTGLVVREVPGRSDQFVVGLAWRGPEGRLPYLGQFGSRDKASAFALELSEMLFSRQPGES